MANYNPGTGKWENSSGGDFDSRHKAQAWESVSKKNSGGGFEGVAAAAGGSMFTLFAIVGIVLYLLITFFLVVIYAVLFWLISIPVFKSFKKRNMNEQKYKRAKIIRWACVVLLLVYGGYNWYYSKPINQTFAPVVTMSEIQKETPLAKQKRDIKTWDIKFIRLPKGEIIKTLTPGENVKILGVKGDGTVCKVETEDGTVGFISPEALDLDMNIIPPKQVSALLRAIGWQFTEPRVTLFKPGRYKTANSDIEIEIGKHELDKSGKGKGDIKVYDKPGEKKGYNYTRMRFTIAKNKPPAEINGIMYNYSIIFLEESRTSDGKAIYIPVTSGDFAGEFVVTSNYSFASEDSKTAWKWEKDSNSF